MIKERQIYNIQPLQLSTIEMVKGSFIRAIIGTPFDVVGSALASKIVIARAEGLAKVPSGNYMVEVTVAGATGTGAYKVHDLDNNTVSDEIITSADPVNVISGLTITIADTDGTSVGDTAQFEVDGDQTRIIPGTIVGRVKDEASANFGKYVPAYDDNIDTLDAVRIVNGYCETDKSKLIPEYSKEVNVSNDYHTSVIVFGEIIEAHCVNLTDTIKSRLNGIVWL